MADSAAPKKAPAQSAARKTVAGKGDRARDLGRVATGEAQRRSAAAWRTRVIGEEVEMPSGNWALLRRPGPEMFLKGGAVPDTLTPIVEAGIREHQGLAPEKAAELGKDPAMMTQMMEMMDAAAVAACIEPVVQRNPNCIRPEPDNAEVVCGESEGDPRHTDKKAKDYHNFIPGEATDPEDRDPDFLYCAEIDFMDKMYIFQYAVGGTRDLERFRQEFEQSLDGIHAVTDTPQ